MTSPVTAAEVLPSERDAAVAAALHVRADGCGPRTGSGTGAVVDADLAVTAAHVVAGASAVEVIGTDGRSTTAAVVHFDPVLDFAVLRLAEPVGEPIDLRAHDADTGEVGIVALPRPSTANGDDHAGTRVSVDISTGTTVDVIDVTVVRAVGIETTDIYLETDTVRAGFEIEGSIDPGDSGALVVLPGGGAGIVWARSKQAERRAWAIDLPLPVLDDALRGTLRDPVDVGPCIR